jgi:N,N'-diacetyllegionaminate synthase
VPFKLSVFGDQFMSGNENNWRGWPNGRTAIIAEVGINHGGDPGFAWEMIVSAHKNGADFVKIQSYVTESFLHPSLTYYSSTKSMELSLDTQVDLFKRAQTEGIELITTVYDFASLDVIKEFGLAAFKVASMDNDNIPLLRRLGELGVPLLVACGMLDFEEMQAVIDVIKQTGNEKIVLMHCVSDYPTQLKDLNLDMIPYMQRALDVPIGLSDHSLGLFSSYMASSWGVKVIEKHFTTDKLLSSEMPDADHDISIDPEELQDLRNFCEAVPLMKGTAPRRMTPGEIAGRTNWKRGIYARRDIEVGEELGIENTVFLRPVPEEGIRVAQWDSIHQKKVMKTIPKHMPITVGDIEL